MRRILPIIFILFGIFFILIPFVGSNPDPEPPGSHSGAAGTISLIFGLFVVIFSTYYLIKGWGPKQQ